LIDENAMIFRNLVWLNPIIVLVSRDITIIDIMNWSFILLFIISIIGAIFCQVNRISALFQLNPSITSGNQKWNGAAPNLIISAEFNISINVEFIRGLMNSFVNNNIITDISRIRDAIACVIKYFIDASVEKTFFFSEKIGITDNRLISNPIHILNQEYDEIEISVPDTMDIMNINLYNLIKKRKILLSLTGYEPISLISLSFYI
jgi:hypothetical protein